MGQLQGPPMGQQVVQDALSDPRAEAMGLGALQDAVRHSFGLLQQALGRPVPQQGLLGPLLGGDDSGARHGIFPNTGGGQLLFASPGALHGSRGAEGERSEQDTLMAELQVVQDALRTPENGQPDRHGVEPRVLDPYGTPAQGASQGVNPFWSDGVQRAAQSQGDHVAASGNNGVQSFGVEVEKLKAKCLREAEEAFCKGGQEAWRGREDRGGVLSHRFQFTGHAEGAKWKWHPKAQNLHQI